MRYFTPAGVTRIETLDYCGSHTLRYFTPAGAIRIETLDYCGSHTLRYFTPAGAIRIETLDSCRSHTLRYLTLTSRGGYRNLEGGGLIIIFTRGQSPRNQRLFIISSSKFFTNMCNKYSSLLHAHNTHYETIHA